jgi:hypothetical protein
MSTTDMYKFKSDCSERWAKLRDQLPIESGVVVAETETDGVKYATLIFDGYGEVINVPFFELEQ